MPDVRTIVRDYLTANGYDGLHNHQCGCDKDDLFPCGYEQACECHPAYRWECGTDPGAGCPIAESEDGCEWAESGGGCDRAKPQHDGYHGHPEDCDCHACREASIVDYPEG